MQRLRALCDQHGMVLVCDEVQSGMGRTGKLWASEHSGVVPDVITTAKSLGAGMPISAIIGRADIMEAPHPGGLGGTYSGNPLSCVAALAALEGRERFSGRSSLRTWLTGILKHKIIDHLRRGGREQPLVSAGDDRSEAEVVDALFAEDGHWREFPAQWGSPAKAFEDSRFWSAFELCLQRLPARTAKVFTMREVMEMTTDEICQELDITTTNCWVMLHRARLMLRECLEMTWFDGQQP